jgi:hypothetical protein
MSESIRIIKKFYKEKLNVPNIVVEYLSIIDIVKISLSGFSNDEICSTLDITIKNLKKDLTQSIGFSGFDSSLDKNPIKLYTICDGDFDIFLDDFDYMVYRAVSIYKLMDNYIERFDK